MPIRFNEVVCGALVAASLAAAAQARAAEVAFDVPKLGGVVIDGDGTDWKNAGFRVEALTPGGADLAPPSDFSASFRLGWDERGLLVLARVVDGSFVEAKAIDDLSSADSLELFWGLSPARRDWVQVRIAPGLSVDHAELRSYVDDHRTSAALTAHPVKIEVARTRTADGYVLEARLPWDCLGLAPAIGKTATLQFQANDVDAEADGGSTPRRQLLWFPFEGAWGSPDKLMPLRLAAQPSPPVRIAARIDAERYPRLSVSVTAPAAMAGANVPITAGRVTLRRAHLGAANGWATASLTLRAAPTDAPIAVGGVPVVLESPAEAKARVLHDAELRFSSHVFSGDDFPSVEFVEPDRISELLGEYRLETSFYDAAGVRVTRPSTPGRYGAIVTVVGAEGSSFERTLTLYRLPEPVRWRDAAFTGKLGFPKAFGIAPRVVDEQSRYVLDFLRGAFGQRLAADESTAVLLAGLAERKPGDAAVDRSSPREVDRRWWVGVRAKLGKLIQYPYATHLPAAYDANPTEKWPLLVFLHGAGERGNDLGLVSLHGPLKEIAAGRDLPFIVVAPQCPDGDRWNTAQLERLIDELETRYRVDAHRVYLTGLSMGGFAVWALAQSNPDRYAAIVTIAAGGDPADVRRIVALPVWDFHGAKDHTVPPERSDEMKRALRAAGAREAQFTVYPDAGHDSWSRTYANPDVYAWLLRHQR